MEEKQASVPFFVHEATLNKLDISNKRMLVALVTVCITLIITVGCFVTAYVRTNHDWMEYAEKLQQVEETQNAGIHELTDPGTD